MVGLIPTSDIFGKATQYKPIVPFLRFIRANTRQSTVVFFVSYKHIQDRAALFSNSHNLPMDPLDVN